MKNEPLNLPSLLNIVNIDVCRCINVRAAQDQLMVWLPEKRVLFPADNIYKAFPNL